MSLTVIEGGGKPRSFHGRGSAEQIVCSRCEEDTGVATSLFVPAIQSPMVRNGRNTGGTKVLVCMHCLARGVTTIR